MEGESCGCGFFPAGAMVNHSCVPSASVQLEGAEMCFYATRDMAAGEEVTQSYANLGGDGRHEPPAASCVAYKAVHNKDTLHIKH